MIQKITLRINVKKKIHKVRKTNQTNHKYIIFVVDLRTINYIQKYIIYLSIN